MNNPIQSYRDLEVWQRGRTLVKAVYGLTGTFPETERFGLISQMRRSSVSIPANIAEGWGRHYPAEFIQFLRKANGSLTELETHLILSQDLGFAPVEKVEFMLAETQILGKQILSLERSINKRQQP